MQNVRTVTGTVKQVKSHTYDSKYGTMRQNTIDVLTDTGETVSVEKHTMSTTAFTLETGAKVQVSFEEKDMMGKNGAYTKRKVIQNGLVLLDSTTSTKPNTQFKTTTTTNTTSERMGYSEGARNGMIVGKAIELAGLKKTLSSAGLKAAADEVLELTKYVESGGNTTTSLKDSKNESPFD